MNLLVWLEHTAFAQYILVGAYGYATMITLHSIGLAIMVGLSGIFSLRTLGFFREIPSESLHRLLKLAWIGFVVNLLSGGALFASQATSYVVDPEFLIKMAFVIVGAVCVALLQNAAAPVSPDGRVATRHDLQKPYAVATLIAWLGALIAGRLIAYL